MGGELRIIAAFPEGEIEVTGFGDVGKEWRPSTRSGHALRLGRCAPGSG